MKRWLKRSLWLLAVLLAALLLVRAFRSDPVLVDVATIARGPLVVTVDDDGRTRVRERYTISAPIEGRLLRPPLKAGAPVQACETVVVEFAPRAPALLDARARAEAQARVESAQAAVEQAKALQAQAEAELAYTQADLERKTELMKTRSESQQEFDLAERDAHRATAGLRGAQFAVQVAEHELRLAQASLLEDSGATPAKIVLQSPIDGRVMRVFEESARDLQAGVAILEVGNPMELEVVADFLSQDAVAVEPGMEVLVEGWSGAHSGTDAETLRGRVRLVEPAGFTKISALGVEEQRVNILVDPAEPLAGWKRLQDGYRVELRVVIWKKDAVTVVPTGALFREANTWVVFVVEEGRARSRKITLGRRTGLEAEVIEGLQPGVRVVLYPSDLIEEGTAVQAR